MKIIKSLTVIIGILIIAFTVSYKTQPQKMYGIYTKLTGNISFNNLAWIFVSTGINVSTASIDIRYKKNSVPNEGLKESLSAKAWRGERVNTQLVIWTTNDLKQVHCITSDLRDTNGNTISSNNIKSFFVRYVMTDVYGGGCGHRKAANFDSSLVADVLDPIL
ncbi:MAG: hypothetical protein MI922_01345, partial [Bacteroidales bacterium]|nr:hypothetical protein [Bacteroidales bacterium]